ncbi:RraA family protein [Priestia megaterium]|nr:RraA family protein [Priestia megaterium]
MNLYTNSGIPTTCLSDALNGFNHLHSSIKPLKPDYTVFGPAFTVQIPIGNNYSVLEGIRRAKAGDILVIDAQGDTTRAIAGDFVMSMAQMVGLKGVVVDGVIRDEAEVKQLGFPVFCKGSTVAASSKSDRGALNIPISCGGVVVHPGDFIVGDLDGVVVIPKEKADSVFSKAMEKMKKDQLREQQVLKSIETVYAYLDDVLAKEK